MPRYSHASPVCTDFGSHLIHILKALPPIVTRSQCLFTDNITRWRMCKGERAIRAPGDTVEDLVFPFWKASKGVQSAVRSEAFDERGRSKVTEEQQAASRLGRFAT